MSRYFILEGERYDSYPLFSSGDSRGAQIATGEIVNVLPGPVALRVGNPIPRHPAFVDFHRMPEPVISAKLFDVLAPRQLFRVQLVPSLVRHESQLLEYWVMNVCNRIPVIDMTKSQYSRDASGDIGILEKIVLDRSKLDAIPELERLCFVPIEYQSVWLIEETIKIEMEKVRPKGVRFYSLEDWDDGVSFR